MVSRSDIQASIRKLVGTEKMYRFATAHPTFLEDILDLGVLMSDMKRCKKHLATLNGRIVTRLMADPIIRSALFSPTFLDRQLKRTDTQIKSSSMKLTRQGDGTVKHYGLLSQFFAAWEASWGFNSAQATLTPGYQDKKTPNLKSFVDPHAFRSFLFAPGYHWKDPGVGDSHGEFTHRIQWYIALQEHAERPFLRNPAVEVFKKFADPNMYGPQAMSIKTAWDYVFDVTAANVVDFRRPEYLHSWLKNPARAKEKKYSVLAQLVAGRSLKRDLEKAQYTNAQGEQDTEFYSRKLQQLGRPIISQMGPGANPGNLPIVWMNSPSSFHKATFDDGELQHVLDGITLPS